MEATGTKVWHGVTDPSHSRVQFKVKHLMISSVLGSFKEFEGNATMAENDFSSADIRFTVNTASIDTNDESRDAHLRSGDFFNAEQYPQMIFEGKGLVPKGEDLFELNGQLTIKNITRPVKLEVEYGGMMTDPWGNKKAGFSVTGEINRKEWEMVWNAALETGGVLVGDKIKIMCDVQFAIS